MMYRSAVVLVFLCCFVVSSGPMAQAPSPVAQAPSVPNPSFESGTDAPESWNQLGRHPYELYLWDTEEVHSEERSISIRGTRYRYGRWKSEKYPVSQDGYTWYTLTGYVKTYHNGGEVYLAIAWYDKANKLITTSDSEMLPLGDSDWQQAAVSALPAAGAVNMEFWCISNHNGGQSWFDDLGLAVEQLPAIQRTVGGNPADAPYDQFLREYPRHPYTLIAHHMRIRSVCTQAKWKKERGHHYPEDREVAVELFEKAAAVPRLDNVLSQVVLPDQLASEQQRFESVVDNALLQASMCSRDPAASRGYLEQIIQRNETPDVVEKAEGRLDVLDNVVEMEN